MKLKMSCQIAAHRDLERSSIALMIASNLPSFTFTEARDPFARLAVPP